MAAKHLNIDEASRNIFRLIQFLLANESISYPSQPSSPPTPSNNPDVPFADLAPASTLPILIRATNGKSKEHRKDKVKLSTVVQPEELEGFFTRYAEVMKAGTTALKKRDRSGRKKATKAKKKGKGGGGGTGEGQKK
ncbi:MAG: hypothetical protein LQ345_000145 [Seirophora villosa]|nr:MAG: hypothetical protein LQ345_000145 [Seirophora villosa]